MFKWINEKWTREYSHLGISALLFILFFLLLTPLGEFSPWISPNDHTGYYSITRIDPGDDTRIHAYLRSMVIDNDIDFFNEIGLWNRFDLTPTGYTFNFMYSIGSAILWLPFFLVGHFIAHFYSLLGYPVSTDGYSFPYLVMTGIGSAIYVFLGVILCYDLLKNFFSERVALITSHVVWLGTHLPFYAFIRSRMAHANEYFMTLLLLYAWFHIRKKLTSPIYLFLFGILAGLYCVIRINDLPVLLFFVVDFIISLFKRYKLKETNAVKKMLKGIAAFLLIFSFIFSIPFLCAHIIWGNASAIGGIKNMDNSESKEVVTSVEILTEILKKTKKENLWRFFFSPAKGVFLSSPFWAISLIGMYFFWKREKIWGGVLLAGLSFPLVFNIIHSSTGLEYGIRRTTPELPFLAFGFAAFFEYTRINYFRWKKTFILIVAILLIAWQYLQLVQHKVILPYNHPTFITSALKNVPRIFTEAPGLLLRSTSWIKLLASKDLQLHNYQDIFFVILLPVLLGTFTFAVLGLFCFLKKRNYLGTNPTHPLIKGVSFSGGLFFVLLPIILLIGNPKKTIDEIEKRQSFVNAINQFDLNKSHELIFLKKDKVLSLIAISFSNSGQIEQAKEFSKKALSVNPDNFQIQFLLATLYHRTNKISEALKAYKYALKINEDNSFIHKNLGVLYFDSLKNNNKALIHFRKSIALAPEQEEAENIKALIKQLSEKAN